MVGIAATTAKQLSRRNSPTKQTHLALLPTDDLLDSERTMATALRKQQQRTSCTAVSMMAGLVLFQIAFFTGQNLLARTSAIFLSTEHMTLLDVVYLHDITICQDVGRSRQCSSPECSVPWPMECPAQAVGTSRTSGHTCGLGCGTSRFATVLESVVDDLTARFSTECSRLVVYSVAFGDTHETTLLKSPMPYNASDGFGSKLNTTEIHESHGRCFFTFVLANENTGNGVAVKQSADGLDWLVTIDQDDLPYTSMRRNAKLVKMHGNLIFPWTERIIWQDAKFRRPEIIHTRPSDYLQWFDHNVRDVCASFYGLPVHKDSVGYHAIEPNYILNEYRHHCEAIVSALRKRPDVTDSMGALLYQCREYLYQHHKKLFQQDLLSLSLIDSAFIGWDMRTPICRDFIAELTCTWADEVQCYSDRDQVSFPHVMRQLQLKVAPSVDPVHHNIVMEHEGHPMVRITQSQCHWYYHELDMCQGNQVVGIHHNMSNVRGG